MLSDLTPLTEYQLWGLDRQGRATWASPQWLPAYSGRLGRALLVAIQVDHERFVDRMGVEAPGCPTSLTARKTVAITFHPVGHRERQCTVWLQHYPPHRKRLFLGARPCKRKAGA